MAATIFLVANRFALFGLFRHVYRSYTVGKSRFPGSADASIYMTRKWNKLNYSKTMELTLTQTLNPYPKPQNTNPKPFSVCM